MKTEQTKKRQPADQSRKRPWRTPVLSVWSVEITRGGNGPIADPPNFEGAPSGG